MDAVEYLKEKARMTSNCTDSCFKCLLSDNKNGKKLLCKDFETKHTEQAVEVVENWAKENPVKTYLTVLLEKFPKTEMTISEMPAFCVKNIFGEAAKPSSCNKISCKQCWNRLYKEEE